MNLNTVLSFTALSGLIIFIGGMFILPSIGGASTGVSTYSLPPKPSSTPSAMAMATPVAMATPMAMATPVAMASPMASPMPIPISALIEIPPPDNMKIITSSDGFKLIVVGTVLFVVSMLIRICYRKDEDEISSRRIIPYQALVLNDVNVKRAPPVTASSAAHVAVSVAPAAPAVIHELKLQVHRPQPQFQPRPPVQAIPQVQAIPYPPRAPVFYRTFKYPPPYDAFNKK